MRKSFLVAWREYAENAKTKGFWIGIFMLPLILFLSFQIPVLLETKGKPQRNFVLVDLSGKFENPITNLLERVYQRELSKSLTSPNTSESVEPKRTFVRVPYVSSKQDAVEIASDLRPFLRGERKLQLENVLVDLHAAIIIPRDIEKEIVRPGTPSPGPRSGGIQYWSANLTDKSLRGVVEEAVNAEVKKAEYLARGMDSTIFQQIENTRVPFLELNPKKEKGAERVGKGESFAQWAPVGFVYLLWVAIFSISQMLLNNTIEEKSNRIIEVLLSSVTPSEYIIGKLAGIAAVGLTMVLAWVSALMAILFWKLKGNSEIAVQAVYLLSGSKLLPAFVVYFLFGYLLYATIILAIGSVCNTLKEAQNYMSIITLLMMVPLFTMTFIPKDPNGALATSLSWFPLFTPFVMMNRAAADPPLTDVVGTMLLLIASNIFALWIAVKIFRIGVLRTGQPPRILEVIRWLRAN